MGQTPIPGHDRRPDALFAALSGSAYAAKKIGTKEIKANAITTGKIKKNAITTAKIKKEAVTGAKSRRPRWERFRALLMRPTRSTPLMPRTGAGFTLVD